MNDPRQPQLVSIPMEYIYSTVKNPRSELVEDEDLYGLATSIGAPDDPKMIEPPVVEEVSKNEYRIIAGERRIHAARMVGWSEISCMVYQPLDPARAHTLRLVENLHRQELHPLDKAVALKISWLIANADAMGLGEPARHILADEQTPADTLKALGEMLVQHCFLSNHPNVSWDDVLDQLGVDLSPHRRKRLLGVLRVDSQVQEKVRDMEISETGLRSIGKLSAADQAQLVNAIEAEPELAQKVRRIAHAVTNHDYELVDAVREAQGILTVGDEPEEKQLEDDETSEDGGLDDTNETAMIDAVITLMELADQLAGIFNKLKKLADGQDWSSFPDPWGEYALSAQKKIHDEIEKSSEVRHVM